MTFSLSLAFLNHSCSKPDLRSMLLFCDCSDLTLSANLLLGLLYIADRCGRFLLQVPNMIGMWGL
jgi:hypothetical protein